MNDVHQHLDTASHEALLVLAGSTIQFVLSADCEMQAGSALITVQTLSIPIGSNGFCVIANDWEDTPEEWIDYYVLSARIATEPDRIHYTPNPGPGGAHYRADHLGLALGAAARVGSIDILMATENGAAESVTYDAGLLISRADGLRIAIVRQQSIAGFLQIAHTEADIARVTTDLEVRCSVVAQDVRTRR